MCLTSIAVPCCLTVWSGPEISDVIANSSFVASSFVTSTVATVEVTKLDATKLEFAMTSEISGPDQTVKQQGTAIDVKHIRGSGQGKGSLDLSTLAMAAELTAKFESEMSSQGQQTPMQ